MSSPAIRIVREERDAAAAGALASGVFGGWTCGRAPRTEHLTPEQALGEQPGDSPLLWWLFAGPKADRSALFNLLDELEQRNASVLLSRSDETEPIGATFADGVVIAPPGATVESLRLVLQTALSQAQLVRTVRQELAISRRHHTGLAGQIDRIDEELRLAAQIQRQFLPETLPGLLGVGFHVLFRPAGYVSGDTYDARRLDEHHIGFYIADAVGHGVPAALLTMFIKQALQGKAVRDSQHRIVPPDEALTQLNDAMLNRYSRSVHFVTACYGVIDCRTRTVQLARAGHPAPLLLRADGSTVPLEPEGPLLGIFETPELELMTFEMNEGDRLVLYSDGFELAFGDEKDPVNLIYMDELARMREGSAEQAVERLEAKLDQASGSLHQRDDITALMLDAGVPAESDGGGFDATELDRPAGLRMRPNRQADSVRSAVA